MRKSNPRQPEKTGIRGLDRISAAEQELVCPACGAKFFPPGAEELAFNSQGACRNCDGTGIVNVVDESWLKAADRMGTVSGNKVDKSDAFLWTMGENGAPLIDDAKVSIECEVDGNYELEHFDHFICKILATYADETVLNEKGKIDYHVFKPVLFEFPTYEYFVTGDKVGNCGRMN